jgi:hypothetical protein
MFINSKDRFLCFHHKSGNDVFIKYGNLIRQNISDLGASMLERAYSSVSGSLYFEFYSHLFDQLQFSVAKNNKNYYRKPIGNVTITSLSVPAKFLMIQSFGVKGPLEKTF